jgi:hypothetical protein
VSAVAECTNLREIEAATRRTIDRALGEVDRRGAHGQAGRRGRGTARVSALRRHE